MARLLAAVIACAVVLAACGGSSAPAGEGDRAAESRETFDVPLGQATCADWRAASEKQRVDVLDQLYDNRNQTVGDDGRIQGRGSVLEQGFAYELLDNRCKPAIADSFLLYKLYAFAAGFGGTSP